MVELSTRLTGEMGQKKRPTAYLVDNPQPVDPSSIGQKTLHLLDIVDGTSNSNIGHLYLEKTLGSDQPDGHKSRSATIQIIRLKSGYYPDKGYGKATYLTLLKYLRDVPLIQDDKELNKYSRAVWKSLVRDGLAREKYSDIDGKRELIGYESITR